MPKGEIVLGCLAPHPPHVVYAENPDQNEPVSEGGWETLRWGYNRLARKLKTIDYDALVIFTPHWQTYIGTHFLGLPEFKSKSVDPVFPNIFRYNYDIKVDVELSEIMREKASEHGIITKMMRNQDQFKREVIGCCTSVYPSGTGLFRILRDISAADAV